MIMSASTILTSIFVIALHLRDPSRAPPKWVQKLVFCGLARFVYLKAYTSWYLNHHSTLEYTNTSVSNERLGQVLKKNMASSVAAVILQQWREKNPGQSINLDQINDKNEKIKLNCLSHFTATFENQASQDVIQKFLTKKLASNSQEASPPKNTEYHKRRIHRYNKLQSSIKEYQTLAQKKIRVINITKEIIQLINSIGKIYLGDYLTLFIVIFLH